MASERESSADWLPTESSGDDDVDYQLATEESEDMSQVDEDVDEDGEEDEEGTTLYFDAESGTLYAAPGVEVQGDEGEGEASRGESTNEPAQATQRPITRLHGIFRPSAGGGITTRSQARRGGTEHVALAEDEEGEEEDDDDDDDDYSSSWLGYGRTRRPRRSNFVGERWPKVPSDEGRKLMASGAFGTNDRCDHTACGKPFDPSVEHKRRTTVEKDFWIESWALVALVADMIINLNARCYSGQFSEDGSFYFACGQDFKVRMYDTSNPYDWKYYKTVNYWGGSWTITDATLSPDNKLLAYSSIRSLVCLARTDPSESSDPAMLNFSDMNSRRGGVEDSGHFGIWSLRFSGDGTEIVAGTSNDSVYVYDLEAQRSILRIPGHQDDVNAVCFGDKMSPHILYSGSDDTTLKIWDRRSLSSMRPAGMFLGHTEGLTYVDSKGDGRYVISNGKDQTCKLWDLRHMISTDVGEKLDPRDFSTCFDYRFAAYDQSTHEPHPHDCSLVTFRGHRVLKTLIRCHFSPALSTDQRYVYSGSHDGKIWVWNMDGTKKATIDVLGATRNSRPASDDRYAEALDYGHRTGTWKTIVRDCSWHPSAPVIAATSWNGWDHQLGTCTVHSWNDGIEDNDEVGVDEDPSTSASLERSLGATPMGARVTAQLQHEQSFYRASSTRSRNSRRAATLRNLGYAVDADDEDE
ncbi:hypothetical protein AMS68_004810 [Peltaster fructicola]|uniref:Uncharacterized protein n=1 Tax=Peltaster fructicola TaxID=286661 RepID=A0A6H0XX19_9PEZI|nr:hypothetical protein AMS68_004810 [Peltaster fructicola]